MSSNILSKQFNITDYGLVFAAAQKNLGPAGVTVIIREDLLERTGISPLPRMFDYSQHVAKSSMVNTPQPMVYGCISVAVDEGAGGLDFDALNARKAKKLYDFLDSQDFY